MTKQELLNKFYSNPSNITEVASELAKKLTQVEIEELTQSEKFQALPKVTIHIVLPVILQPYFPALLPLYKDLIEKLFVSQLQFKQALILDYLGSLLHFQPEKAGSYTAQIDALVHELKEKDASVKLVRAQTLQISYHLQTGNLQKAKALLMSTRAQKIRLPADIQKQLDFVSGSVMIFCGEYTAAAGYYSEGGFHAHVCISKILNGEWHQIDRIASQIQKKEDITTEEKDLVLKLYQLSLAFLEKKYLQNLQEITQEIKTVFKPTFEMEFALNKLIENEVQKTVLKILKPYRKIQLEQLSNLTGLKVEMLQQLLTKLIVNGQLNYIIDGETNSLVKIVQEVKGSEGLLREAYELVEVLQSWV
ncbi:26S_proteasome regulatory complex component [Hexamita inflata]|uniref:26S proteasome regulatory complex component n=1 Tax=Hexamita inflata TaxID=28002 RepID=A0AA86R673_9EUKA|nr:26S proteasome regulatory complex component [Hexamita inflata]